MRFFPSGYVSDPTTKPFLLGSGLFMHPGSLTRGRRGFAVVSQRLWFEVVGHVVYLLNSTYEDMT